eukprot:Plantae.Rhodophyta-Palmaria_palmata.ctg4768.p1 GENE.Plantae.Rhodophyta-Palmaria_palmata.ctg4768~~Plantae.Rhodophyta-Palmaria_palmata.ctg4768.p1  ORF type:complete len:145 (+),score=1.80 Plantae.Rhodophyta-Palmaria_palmata.ctg4768:201-635(+)
MKQLETSAVKIILETCEQALDTKMNSDKHFTTRKGLSSLAKAFGLDHAEKFFEHEVPLCKVDLVDSCSTIARNNSLLSLPTCPSCDLVEHAIESALELLDLQAMLHVNFRHGRNDLRLIVPTGNSRSERSCLQSSKHRLWAKIA